jgi:sugar phosphate isomerase/epimerase
MSLHPRICLNCNCFGGAGWPELTKAFAALQPQRISLNSLLLAEDPGALARLLAEGYALESLVHPFLYGEALDAGEEPLARAQERLDQVIEAVAAAGGRSIYLGTGGAGSLTWEEAAERFAAAVAPCREHASRAGVALMVENIPPLFADMSIATSLRDALALAELAGLGVCIDLLGCWTEAGLRETFARAAPRCGLVQVSDHVPGDRALPGRAVPGDGAVPLRRMIGWALEDGYAGAFDLELTGPRIAAEGHVRAVSRAAAWLDAVLEELGA